MAKMFLKSVTNRPATLLILSEMQKFIRLSSTFSSKNYNRKAITKEISFITSKNNPSVSQIDWKKDKNAIQSYKSNGRPLSVLLFWLMAHPKSMDKYIKIYLEGGFDILAVRINPWQLAWPRTSFHVAENDLFQFLHDSDHSKKIVHGFSVGAYIFTRLLIHIERHPEHQKVLDSFYGHIWESVVDVSGAPYGISKTTFFNSPRCQKILQKLIELHLKVMRGPTTQYLEESHDTFYYKNLMSPGLFIGSKEDPISSPELVNSIRNSWAARGVESKAHIWSDTAHVSHWTKHPEEYIHVLRNFWDSVGIAPALVENRENTLIQKNFIEEPSCDERIEELDPRVISLRN